MKKRKCFDAKNKHFKLSKLNLTDKLKRFNTLNCFCFFLLRNESELIYCDFFFVKYEKKSINAREKFVQSKALPKD